MGALRHVVQNEGRIGDETLGLHRNQWTASMRKAYVVYKDDVELA